MSKQSEQNEDRTHESAHTDSSSSHSHRHSSSGSSSHHSSSGSSHHSSSGRSNGGKSHHSSSGSSHHSSSSGSSHHSSSSDSSHGSSSHHSTSSGHDTSADETHHSSDSRSSSAHHHHTVQKDEKIDALVQKYTFVPEDDMPEQSDDKKTPHHHHRHSRRFSRRRRIKRILIALVSIPLALIVIAASVFGVLNVLGKRQIQKDAGGMETNPFSVTYDEGKTVEYNGQTYVLNENIVTVAAIGLDRESFGLQDDKIGTAGQADFILIVTMDLQSGFVSPIMIPRDTMVDVDQFSIDGQYVGVENMQICLSFAYGDGAETSSRNVLTSVQRVLYGVPVHLYGVLDLDGIPAMNDAIGGVSVTLQENFGGSYAGDRITLHGDQAETFVRARDTSRMDSDAARRARQIQYVHAYIDKATHAAIRDLNIIRKLYNTAMEYAFTNVSLSKATYIATTLLAKGVNIGDVKTLAGTLQAGDPYAEYILDEKAAFETVLNVFYTPLLGE